MSRIGKLCLFIPKNCKIILTPRHCHFLGSYGKLSQLIPKSLSLRVTNLGIFVNFQKFSTLISEQQGLLHALLQNKIIGVSKQFEKKLELIGVGYRAYIDSEKLILLIGASYTTFFFIPISLTVNIITNTQIIIQGIDKHSICLFASKIRSLKPPEPYKGKGIKYFNESIIRKIGKSTSL